MGKYHRIAGTEIKQRSGRPGVRFNEAAERIEHRGIFPALVDRETWERVQEKLLAVLLGKLREEVLAGGHRQELRQHVLEGLRAKQSAPADVGPLRSRVADLDKQADAVVDQLWSLCEELQRASPARLRELVHQMVSRIRLRFGRRRQGRRTIYPFLGGKVDPRPDPVLYRLVSRGDSRCTFVNEINGLWLVLTLFPQLLCFPGDAVLKYVEPGLYSKRR